MEWVQNKKGELWTTIMHLQALLEDLVAMVAMAVVDAALAFGVLSLFCLSSI